MLAMSPSLMFAQNEVNQSFLTVSSNSIWQAISGSGSRRVNIPASLCLLGGQRANPRMRMRAYCCRWSWMHRQTTRTFCCSTRAIYQKLPAQGFPSMCRLAFTERIFVRNAACLKCRATPEKLLGVGFSTLTVS